MPTVGGGGSAQGQLTLCPDSGTQASSILWLRCDLTAVGGKVRMGVEEAAPLLKRQ